MTKDTDQENGLGKVCTKCGEWKLLDDYYARKKTEPDKKHNQCKQCIKEKVRLYELDNKEKVATAHRIWRISNKERVDQTQSAWRKNNPDKVREYQYKWNQANPEKVKKAEDRRRRKDLKNPKIRLSRNISRAVRHSLVNGGKPKSSTFDILGYSCEDLISHLEAMFVPGMSWDNYGVDGWEIDHVIPLKAHNFSSVYHQDFKRCWSLENLQPMWAKDNRSKGAKLASDFQPSFAF